MRLRAIVQDVGLLQATDDENSRVRRLRPPGAGEGTTFYLIGLSSLPTDVERNTDLLLHGPVRPCVR